MRHERLRHLHISGIRSHHEGRDRLGIFQSPSNHPFGLNRFKKLFAQLDIEGLVGISAIFEQHLGHRDISPGHRDLQ